MKKYEYNYEKEIERLCSALDVIGQLESYDSRDIKRNIRAEIDRLEKIENEMIKLAKE